MSEKPRLNLFSSDIDLSHRTWAYTRATLK